MSATEAIVDKAVEATTESTPAPAVVESQVNAVVSWVLLLRK